MPSLVNINSISPDLRDYLLGLNLQPSNVIINNNYTNFLSGVGFPIQLQVGSVLQPKPNETLQGFGSIYRAVLYSNNEYQVEPDLYSDSGQVIGDNVLSPIDGNNIKNGYLDSNGKLNVGGPSTEPYNIISSLVKGGVGFNKNGGSDYSIVSNNDIRNTIVGRALTAGGIINDTDLGIIGAQRLAISLGNNAAFKLQKETIGKVNLDIFSWIDGKKDDFIVPNYEITVPAGALGKAVDFLGDLAGFTRPKSQMKTDFFSFDDKFQPTLIGNIARANGMLETTGKGQVIALFRNLQANTYNTNKIKQGYVPGIVNKRVDGKDELRHNVYAFGNSDGEIIENTDINIPDSAVYGNSRWTDIDGSGFEGDYFSFKTGGNGGNTEGLSTESDFVWSDESFNNDKNIPDDLIKQADDIFGVSPTEGETNGGFQPNRKSILYKTKELFKTNKMSTLVNGHGIDTNRSQIQSAVTKGGENYIMSKGNAALTKTALNGNFSDYSNIFCRTWTPMDKYDQVNDLVRNRSIDVDGGTYNRRYPLSEYSVLENTGFVKIAQYVSDKGSVKRHMFSIENLAYKDITGLPNCEKGPNGGRIMWFPPYDIKFSESTSVNWDKHNFIGRGEPMYTYNNAERTGQLSFKVIIDHPNHLNRKEKNNILKDDDHFYSFFAGCNPLEMLPLEQQNKEEIENNPKPEVKVDEPTDVKPSLFHVFFPNDNWEYPYDNPEYESGLAYSSGTGNIKTIVKTDADKNKDYVEYNKIMGYPDDSTGTKTLGPINPINLSPSDYDEYKIDYKKYPRGWGLGLGMTKNKKVLLSTVTTKYVDRTNFGLNANRHDAETWGLNIPGVGKWASWLAGNDIDGTVNKSYLEALKEHMGPNGACKNCVIQITGYASVQGNVSDTKGKNKRLSDKRANTIRQFLLDRVIDKNDPIREQRIELVKGNGQTELFSKRYAQYIDENGESIQEVCSDNTADQDSLACKLNRRVQVNFILKPELRNQTSVKKPVNNNISPKAKQAIKTLVASQYAECDFFNKLSTTDPVTYSKITDKIKFFTPAFHSTTPEGFNARLTFLQQCTRQGPSIYELSDKPDNLVFGRPPVCVLRIGDFYHTKIIIENISFDFEPLVWDLNPEGIGVQPMIANVSMNFAFIGGQSLDGPIAKLQNGISRNYFANTGLYDTNADDNSASTGITTTSGATIADKNYNETIIIKDETNSILPDEDKALTAEKLDLEILKAGVLSLKYDDSGLFQGKVKGKFTIKSKLSKDYTIKLRTSASQTNLYKKLGDEPIDVQTLKLNDLKVDFTSKSKTTNSLQKWDNYFTDTINYKPGSTTGFLDIYESVQESLNTYYRNNTSNSDDMTGNEAKGWDYLKDSNLSVLITAYNYDFYIDIEGLGNDVVSLPFRGRWVPKFKVDSNWKETSPADPDNGIDAKYHYDYTAYLSGGNLFIINENDETADEVADRIKELTKAKETTDKNAAKDKKEQEKIDKANKKSEIEKQKTLVKNNNGSLL